MNTQDPAPRMRRALIGVGAVAATALLAAGCGSSDDSTSATSADTTVSTASGSNTLAYTIGDSGCQPGVASVAAGPVNFEITNDGSEDVTELYVKDGETTLAERENILDGKTATLSVNLEEGDYTIFCPNAEDPGSELTVTPGSGGSGATETAQDAVDTYRAYVEENTRELVAATKPFVAAVVAGEVAKAKSLYPAARIPYERIEPVAESFGDLDPKIDAREGDVPKKDFGGFHRIEKALWVENTTEGMAPVAKQLLVDCKDLANRASKLKLQAAQIANGANGLLDEVSASKITGEEERYSHIDLVDFEANVDGSNVAFQTVQPILAQTDPKLSQEITDRFDAVTKALEPYRDGDSFVLYTELTKSDTRKLSQVIDALAEPLSKVAAQIVQ